jgi:hypothetical protein
MPARSATSIFCFDQRVWNGEFEPTESTSASREMCNRQAAPSSPSSSTRWIALPWNSCGLHGSARWTSPACTAPSDNSTTTSTAATANSAISALTGSTST